MKRQGKVLLAAAMLALFGVSCFSDPTDSLRNGPTRIDLDRSAAFIKVGDSLAVTAQLRDDQGNYLATTGASWASADPTIAVVHPDTVKPAPGAAFSRAQIVAVGTATKSTTVTVTIRGASATAKVTLE